MADTLKHTDQLPRREIAYYRRRQQNRVFAHIAQFFAEEAEAGRITRKEIADKLGKDPAQVTRWLSAPANFELDTISDWLLAMGAEMDTRIVRFVGRAKPNFAHPLTITATVSSNQRTTTTFVIHTNPPLPETYVLPQTSEIAATASTPAPILKEVMVEYAPL